MRNPKDISFTTMSIAMRSKGLISRNATIMAPTKISRLIMVATSLALVAGRSSFYSFRMNTTAIKADAAFSHFDDELIATAAIVLRTG
jgi:hypothetical protein